MEDIPRAGAKEAGKTQEKQDAESKKQGMPELFSHTACCLLLSMKPEKTVLCLQGSKQDT